MNRLAIFDCDGTLVDSQGNICVAMEQAFASVQLPLPTRDATRRVVGLSLVEAMRELHPHGEDALHVDLADRYKAAFTDLRQAGTVYEPMFEGIAECIDELETAGWVLGVATGKSDRGLRFVIEQHDLAKRFVTLHTADRHPSKPNPAMIEACIADAGAEPETTVMIGDTSFDMAMAKAANVMAIGVSWGYHPVDELKSSGADIVIDHPRDIAPTMKEIG